MSIGPNVVRSRVRQNPQYGIPELENSLRESTFLKNSQKDKGVRAKMKALLERTEDYSTCILNRLGLSVNAHYRTLTVKTWIARPKALLRT